MERKSDSLEKGPVDSLRKMNMFHAHSVMEKTCVSGGTASTSAEIYHFLRGLISLTDLPNERIQELADHSRLGIVPAGEYIAMEGDEDGKFGFIVLSGRLALLKNSISGRQLIVELLARGDIFGLLLMLAAKAQVAQLSARAQLNSKVLWVSNSKLQAVLTGYSTVYHQFVAHLVEHLQSSYRLARGLAHDRVEVRIATILVTLADKYSRIATMGQANNIIDITRQQVADLTGTTIETAIRVTRAMQKEKLIEMKRPGEIRVLHRARLEEIAELE